MDAIWAKNLYEPTSCPTEDEELPKDVDFDVFAKNVQTVTENIKEFPHDPVLWLLRAQMLVCLRFPELAAGDAHKARLLTRNGLGERTDSNRVWEKTRLAFAAGMAVSITRRYLFGPTAMQYADAWHGFWSSGFARPQSLIDDNFGVLARAASSFLTISLRHCNAAFDLLAVCKEASAKFGGGSDPGCYWNDKLLKTLEMRVKVKAASCKFQFPGEEAQAATTLRAGEILHRRYPWMGEDFFDRSADVNNLSIKLLHESDGRCKIQASDIGRDAQGVFALKDMCAGEQIFVSHSIMTANSSTTRCPTCCRPIPDETAFALECCGEIYCAEGCALRAKQRFHAPLCNVDLSCLAGEDENKDMAQFSDYVSDRLFSRVLALCVQQVSGNALLRHKNPLKALPDVNRLKAGYSSIPGMFSFERNIAVPTELLTRMGIDVFADHRFDTWVLMTLAHRMTNNLSAGALQTAQSDLRRGDTVPHVVYLDGIFPTHTMVNHSCAPNAEVVCHGTLGSQKIVASQDIREGEEIFISYTSVEGLDVEERGKAMEAWLGSEGCQCSLCVRERGG